MCVCLSPLCFIVDCRCICLCLKGEFSKVFGEWARLIHHILRSETGRAERVFGFVRFVKSKSVHSLHA